VRILPKGAPRRLVRWLIIRAAFRDGSRPELAACSATCRTALDLYGFVGGRGDGLFESIFFFAGECRFVVGGAGPYRQGPI